MRVAHLTDLELGGVGLVYGVHHLGADVRESLGATEVLVDHVGGRVGVADHDTVTGALADAEQLGGMVIEGQRHLGPVGQIGRDVVGRQLDLAVLDVLWVHEQDVLEDPELLQQGGADQTVEVAAGDEAVGAIEGDRGGLCGGHGPVIGRSQRTFEYCQDAPTL